jgi:hypothetical protein
MARATTVSYSRFQQLLAAINKNMAATNRILAER